jgi:hypothetical protein
VAAGRRTVEALAPEDPARRGERLAGERAGTERLDRGLERTAGGADVAVLLCARLSPDHERIGAGGSVAGDTHVEILERGVAALQEAIQRAARVAHSAGARAGHDPTQQVDGALLPRGTPASQARA